MKYLAIFFIIVLFFSPAFSTDSSEERTPISPLFVYTGGISAGAVFSLTDKLSKESEQFLKVSFTNAVAIREMLDMFIDFDWFAPGTNLGGDLGFDVVTSRSDFRPILGVGVGAHFFDKEDNNFGENFGASLTAHLGFYLDISETLIIRVRAPYHITFNSDKDMAVGLDLGLLFGSRHRGVEKLNY